MKKVNHNHSAVISYFCLFIIYLTIQLYPFLVKNVAVINQPINSESYLALGLTPPKKEIQIINLEQITGISTKKAKLINSHLQTTHLKSLEEIDWTEIKGVGEKTAEKINQELNLVKE